jgi:mono/diheme cytochrome c family protein
MVDGSHYEVKLTTVEWRTLWLWIESGAPYVGSYAGLRNTEQQEVAGTAPGAVFGQHQEVLQRRCANCHSVGSEAENAAKPLPYPKEWSEQNKKIAGRPTGAYERVLLKDDPIARYSTHALLNFTRPELSPLLLAPLAKAAGGLESCGIVFRDRTDPDYKSLLAGLRKGQALLDAEPRFGAPGFKPNRQYVREMKRFGVLPAAFDLTKNPLDVFQTDQSYWKSLWYQPLPIASARRGPG